MARNRNRNSRVAAKGTRPKNWSGGGPPPLPQPRREPELAELVRAELRADDAFGFLTFVSSMCAVSDVRNAEPFGDRDDKPVPALGLLETFVDAATTETDALLMGYAALATWEEEREFAADAVAQLSPQRRMRLPLWLQRLGEAKPVRAVSQHDHGLDWSFEIIEVDLGGTPMSMMLNVWRNAGYSLNDGYPAPASIADVKRLAAQSDDVVAVYDDLDLGEAAARYVYAIEREAMSVPRTETETWPQSRALFDWVARLAGPAETCDFEWDEPAETFESDMMARFLASPMGVAAAKSGATTHLDTLWWYSSGYGHAKPLIWGPERAWIALTDWFPRKVMCSPDEAAGFPELVRAWVEFAHAETEVPTSFTAEVMEAIDEALPVFVEATGDADRPTGIDDLMQRMGALMDLDDVDDDGEMIEGLLGGSSSGGGGRGMDFETWQATQDETLREQALWTIEHAIGTGDLTSISKDPLPVEDFEYSGTEPDIAEALTEWVGHIDRACDALLDDEVRTACLRFLHKVAVADPQIFRRKARVDRGALALIWSVGVMNTVFERHMAGGGPSIMVSDLVDFFNAPKSGHTSRAATMLDAIGVERGPRGELLPGDQALLTSAHRRRLITRFMFLREP